MRKKNFAIKREQRQARLDSAERKQSQDRKAGLKEKEENSSELSVSCFMILGLYLRDKRRDTLSCRKSNRSLYCLPQTTKRPKKVFLFRIASTLSLQFVVGFYVLIELYHGSLDIRREPEVAYTKCEDTKYTPTDEGEI